MAEEPTIKQIIEARETLLEALENDGTRRLATQIAMIVINLAMEHPVLSEPMASSAEMIVASYVDTEHIPNWQGMVADLLAMEVRGGG